MSTKRIDTDARIERVRLQQQTDNPASPSAGYWYLFVKSGGVYAKNAAGTVVGPLIDAASLPAGTFIVQESDVTVVAAATTLDFGVGFDVTESPSGEANVGLDLTEIATADHDHDGTPTQKLAQANTHEAPDTDDATSSLHHTIGAGATQSAAGNHTHGGGGGLTHSYLGYNTIGASSAAVTAFRIYAKKITVATAGFLASIDVYTKASQLGATPNIEAAVWTDDAGDPEYVIAFGGNGRSSSGNVLLEKASAVQDPRWLSINIGTWLVAGDYWIGVAVSAAVLDFYYDGSGSDRYWTPGDLFMNDYGQTAYGISSVTTTTDRYSIRANFIS